MRGLETRSSRPDDVARLLAQLRVPDVRATIIDEMEQGKVQILGYDLVCMCSRAAPCRACV
jgi:hypothetical protein